MAAFFIGFACWFFLWWFLVGRRGLFVWVLVVFGCVSSSSSASLYDYQTGLVDIYFVGGSEVLGSGPDYTQVRGQLYPVEVFVRVFSFGSYAMGTVQLGQDWQQVPLPGGFYYVPSSTRSLTAMVWVDGRVHLALSYDGGAFSEIFPAVGSAGVGTPDAPFMFADAGMSAFHPYLTGGLSPGRAMVSLSDGFLSGHSYGPGNFPSTQPSGGTGGASGEFDKTGWLGAAAGAVFDGNDHDDSLVEGAKVGKDSIPDDVFREGVGFTDVEASADAVTAGNDFATFLHSFLGTGFSENEGSPISVIFGGGSGDNSAFNVVGWWFSACAFVCSQYAPLFYIIRLVNNCLLVLGTIAFCYSQFAWGLGWRDPERIVPPTFAS